MKRGIKITIGIFIGIFTILGLLIAILIGVAAISGGKYDKSSKEFVDTIIPKIISEWDYSIFIEFSHPDMPSSVSREIFENRIVLPIKNQLGNFISYDSSEGEATIRNINGKTTIDAKYSSRVTFENGNAVITVELLFIDENWVLTNFNIRSNELELAN